MTKVIQKIGLCIGFYDLLESSDGLIGHGNGLVNVNGELTLEINSCVHENHSSIILQSSSGLLYFVHLEERLC